MVADMPVPKARKVLAPLEAAELTSKWLSE